MIEYKAGDIFAEDAEALVNAVNCVGVMGRGVALQFKRAFPENFRMYEAACRQGEVQPGNMFVFETGQFTNPRYIINFPTKRHWRDKSRQPDIDAGLASLLSEVRARDIRSIAMPALGSGLGGLPWPDVRSSIERALGVLQDVEIVVFEPRETPGAEEVITSREAPKMTEADPTRSPPSEGGD